MLGVVSVGRMSYNGQVNTITKLRDHRLDARCDGETHALVKKAAEIVGETVSVFVVTAARERAEKLVARSDRTIMPATQFDAMMAAFDDGVSNPKLQDLLGRPGRIAI